MKRTCLGTHIGLVILAALLALPLPPSASPVTARQRARTVTRTFNNTTRIELPEAEFFPISADLYPSPITVGGLRNGKIRDVNVTLNSLTHDFPDDVEVLLVGPRGQTAIVMAHVGDRDDVTDVSLRLDDEAQAPIPGTASGIALQSGVFRPTYDIERGPAIFNTPAPNRSANEALSVFDGT
ncbi:MAG: alkaline phosphatase [Thermomicrobiales bacterium]|nr:alkaline phosphatase [Thermomicrobiales bacterium]